VLCLPSKRMSTCQKREKTPCAITEHSEGGCKPSLPEKGELHFNPATKGRINVILFLPTFSRGITVPYFPSIKGGKGNKKKGTFTIGAVWHDKRRKGQFCALSCRNAAFKGKSIRQASSTSPFIQPEEKKKRGGMNAS